MPGSLHGIRYCTGCTLYIAVFGFKGGSYTIIANQGLTRLWEGVPHLGTADSLTPQYYEYYNPRGEQSTLQVRDYSFFRLTNTRPQA